MIPSTSAARVGSVEKDLRIRKWDVEEETDLRLGNPLAHECRRAKKLEVVNPDQVAARPLFGHCIGESLIYRLIYLPAVHAQGKTIQAIVTHRPDHAIGDFFVESP